MKRIILTLVSVVLLMIAGLFIFCGSKLRTLATLRQIDEHPFYLMTYYGDYGFEEFLKKGARNDQELEEFMQKKIFSGRILEQKNGGRSACSCFSAMNEKGESIFGRNFDWDDHPALLMFARPKNGYASVSMVDISYLGYDRNNLPASSWINRIRLLAAPYIPFDGMNECGLAIGEMLVPFGRPGKNPGKATIGSSQAKRLVLDYAKDVEEAISLLRKYNIYFSADIPVHYLISDSAGNSAVIEFLNGKIEVIRNKEPWQVATNFIIYGSQKQGTGHDRYKKASGTLKNKKGIISELEAMGLLKNISKENTLWSVVYNLITGEFQIVMKMKYDKVNKFRLETKNKLKNLTSYYQRKSMERISSRFDLTSYLRNRDLSPDYA